MLTSFFADLLPRVGNFALWTKHNKKHHWTDSQDGLVVRSEHLIDRPDTYFATAAFGNKVSDTTGGTARTQDNVIARRCFHADLDCGAEKYAKNPDRNYPTQRDAIEALVAFEKDTGIKFSHVLSSGAGIHAYLALDEDIDNATWKPIAHALQALADHKGLKLDHACTTDSARVLRAPGTLHNNGQRVKLLARKVRYHSPHSLAADIVSLLPEAARRAPKTTGQPKRASINDDILVVEGPPKSIALIARKCGAIGEVVRKKGNVSEPLWRAMIGITKYTVEGVKAAHLLSKGHPEYDPAATQDKFDRWTVPPPSCAEFGKHTSACGSCPLRGTIKSPISTGYMTARATEALPPEQQPAATKPPAPTGDAWDGCLPSGFKVKSAGKVNTLVWSMPVEKEDGDGDKIVVYVDVPITNDIFWFGQWADAEHDSDTAQTVMHKWDGHQVVTYTFDQTLLANQQKFREFLAGKSIITATHKHSVRAMEEFAKAQHQRIRALGRKPKINSRFGLRILPDGQLVAAQGKHVIYPNGEVREAMLGNELKATAAKFAMPLPPSEDGMWGPEVWDSHIVPAARRHVDFMRTHYSAPGLGKFRLAAMMALASPLQAFVTGEYVSGVALPPTGLTVSMYSANGGRGKTTLMRAAMLAYGKPDAMTRDSNSMGSTDKGRIARLSLMGTTPIGMDEMGDNSVRSVASLISAIANGTGREGATVDGGLRTGATWSLMCLIGTNKSQRDMIAAAQAESPAIQYRLLELDVEHVSEFSGEQRAAFTEDWSRIADTAGALGAVIHRAICRMGAPAINALVLKTVNAASEQVGADQTARFQYRGLGAVIALHALLKKEGLALFSLQDIVKEFKTAHDEAKSFVTENIMPSDELELLNIFLNDMHEHTVVTKACSRYNVGAPGCVDIPLGDNPKITKVRHVVGERRSYVAGDALREWAQAKHVPYARIVKVAVDAQVIERPVGGTESRLKTQVNLRKGMADSTGARVRCYTINVGRLTQLIGQPYDTVEYVKNVVSLHQGTAPAAEPSTQAQASM